MAKKRLVFVSKLSCAVFLVCMLVLLYMSFTDSEEIDLTVVFGVVVFWPGFLAAVVMAVTFCIEFVLEMAADFKERRFRALWEYLARLLVTTVVFAVGNKIWGEEKELWNLRILTTAAVCATSSKAVEYWSRIKKQQD